MSTIITPEYARKHSRIDYNSAEDEIIEDYILSAEGVVLSDIDRTLEDCYEQFDERQWAMLKHAVLFLTDVGYEHRTPVSHGNMYIVPYTYEALIKPLMNL